ncbi:MAG: alpha/beta hydrolase [Chloroflexi bacterium]|nr:alpha/beta hydrolase [Chloroflexota bacterium]MCI0579771.1 alpha/beta hydrolase [Chloroflexota bacterium]MCI0649143.1 alpha/beta hydrolase [Chloroflexota bacterium]MCI0731249.1 alpha/beta hydrolase [Chloroflexota bacterium]
MSWFEHGTSRIYYEDNGNGDPVLLLPGFAGSIEEFSALREVLVAANYRVIAADLPGSGRSQPQPREYTATYFEDDARSFAVLLQHLAVGPAHLMGFSDGGEVSLLMAALTPDVARSVVTWGAAGTVSDPDGQLREAMYNVVDNPIPPLQHFSEHLVATYGEANARAMTRSLVGALGDIIENGGDISLSKAGNITCPVLLIAGEHDVFAPLALLSQLAAHIRSAEVLKAEGAGHDVHNAQPEWLAQTILDWLKRQ